MAQLVIGLGNPGGEYAHTRPELTDAAPLVRALSGRFCRRRRFAYR